MSEKRFFKSHYTEHIIDKANAMEELNRSSGQSSYDEVEALAEKYDDMSDE